MKRLCYCPACQQSKIITAADELEPYWLEKSLTNTRGGFGRPITHYKCNCGNFLAGSMDVSGWDGDGIDYTKSIIREYNEGGRYFTTSMLNEAMSSYMTRRIDRTQ